MSEGLRDWLGVEAGPVIELDPADAFGGAEASVLERIAELAEEVMRHPPPTYFFVSKATLREAFPYHWKAIDRLFHPLRRHGGRREKAVERKT
jgi:hypothetical protein